MTPQREPEQHCGHECNGEVCHIFRDMTSKYSRPTCPRLNCEHDTRRTPAQQQPVKFPNSTELLLMAHTDWKNRIERKHTHEEIPWVDGWIHGYLTPKPDFIRKQPPAPQQPFTDEEREYLEELILDNREQYPDSGTFSPEKRDALYHKIAYPHQSPAPQHPTMHGAKTKCTEQMHGADAMLDLHEKRMRIRRAIQTAGRDFFESLSDIPELMYIAGEFQSLNEDWAMNNEGTYGYDHLMKAGYSHNQAKWIKSIAAALRQQRSNK